MTAESNSALHALVDEINLITRSPLTAYTLIGDQRVSNLGNYHLSSTPDENKCALKRNLPGGAEATVIDFHPTYRLRQQLTYFASRLEAEENRKASKKLERKISLFNSPAKWLTSVTWPNGRIIKQEIVCSKEYTEGGESFHHCVTLNFDDPSGKGRERFRMQSDIKKLDRGLWVPIHNSEQEVAKRFPELAHLLKWENMPPDESATAEFKAAVQSCGFDWPTEAKYIALDTYEYVPYKPPSNGNLDGVLDAIGSLIAIFGLLYLFARFFHF